MIHKLWNLSKHKPEHPKHQKILEFDSFSDAADYYMDTIQKAYENGTLRDYIEAKHSKDSGLKVFTNSLYSVHISRWMEEFDR